MIRVVLDTNILISALLNKRGAPAQALLLTVEEPDVRLFMSMAIFTEYEEVLRRPRFQRSEGEISSTLAAIRQRSIWLPPRGACTRL